MDKYEAFKEWIAEQRIMIVEVKMTRAPSSTPSFIDKELRCLFKGFEKSLEDDERDEKLKEELLNAILKCGTKGCTVDRVMDVLIEGDYLK